MIAVTNHRSGYYVAFVVRYVGADSCCTGEADKPERRGSVVGQIVSLLGHNSTPLSRLFIV